MGVSLLSLVEVAVPTFWSGLMLMWIFAVHWNLLPSFGLGSLRHLIMPAVTLGAPALAMIARLTRSEMLEVLPRKFIRTARSKGLSNYRVTLKHALSNALLPVVNFTGMQFGVVLGYAAVTETVFAWPGLGRLLVESMVVRDYPMIQGLILLFCFFFILNQCFGRPPFHAPGSQISKGRKLIHEIVTWLGRQGHTVSQRTIGSCHPLPLFVCSYRCPLAYSSRSC